MDRSRDQKDGNGPRPEKEEAAPAVHRVEFSLDWPPRHAAAYLVETPKPVLVDAGVPGDAGEAELREGLSTHGYAVDDVAHLLLTHPHSDHLGQVPALRDAGATVYAAGPALDRLRRSADDLGAGVRETARSVGLDDGGVDREVDRALDSLRRNRRLLRPDEVDVSLAYGERFDAGSLSVEPLHTPGHQAEHVAFAVDHGGERRLFSGDVLVEPFRAAALNVGLDRGAADAVAAYYEAYDRLAGRRFDRVFPGHGPSFDDYATVLESSETLLDAMVADVRRALASVAPASPVDVTRERGKRLDPPAALLDTVGALGYLEQEGVVTHDVVDGVRRYRPA